MAASALGSASVLESPWHSSEHLEAALTFYCWVPHRAVLSKEQKCSFPQLGLGTHEVQLGSSQPNKASRPGLITAEPSLPTEMLFTSLLCGQWNQSDLLWARILCGIRRLKEYYGAAPHVMLDQLCSQESAWMICKC